MKTKEWLVVISVMVVVAILVSLVTANLTGNVINVDAKKKGTAVYTKAEVDNLTTIGVANFLNNCSRTRIQVNPYDAFWENNSQPTGDSLCAYENKKGILAMLSEVTKLGVAPPEEWGDNTNSGLWSCHTDAKSVYGRSRWTMYGLDAVCC